MTKYLIEFKKQTGAPVYYQGTFSGMGKQYNFTEAAALAQQFATQQAAEAIIATLPMAEVLQAAEHQFGD